MDLQTEKRATEANTQNVLKSSFQQNYPETSENKIALSISSERFSPNIFSSAFAWKRGENVRYFSWLEPSKSENLAGIISGFRLIILMLVKLGISFVFLIFDVPSNGSCFIFPHVLPSHLETYSLAS